MARTKRSAALGTRTSRLKLLAGKAHQDPMGKGEYLGYRRPRSAAAGSWFARVRVEGKIRQKAIGAADDYADPNGKTVLSFEQAQVKARRWFDRAHGEALGERIHTGPFTVADAMEAYLSRMERDGQTSARDARNRCRLWILPTLGKAEVEKLTRPRLEKWRDAMAAHAGKVRGAKDTKARDREMATGEDARRARKATANRTLAYLKAALTYAKDQGLVSCPDDAWTLCKPFRKVDDARQAYLTPDEQTRLVNGIEDPDFRRLVTGALLTGCRYGELARMEVRDYEPNPGAAGTVLVRKGKDGKSRRVILTEEGRTFFEGITAGRPDRELMFQKTPDSRLKAVKRGELQALPWEPSDQLRRMGEACAAAGLPSMGFHQLRHSYASALVTAGMPLAMVAKLTGHADTRMLEKHYAHLAPSDLSRALEALAPKLGIEAPNVATLMLKKKA